MAKRKVMKLIDPITGLMECTVCQNTHYSVHAASGHYVRGSWQCVNGCQPDILGKTIKRMERLLERSEHLQLQFKKIEIRKEKYRKSLVQNRKKKN